MAIDSHETSSAVKEVGEVGERERERERANDGQELVEGRVGLGGGGGGLWGHGGRQLDSGQKEKERREGECSE